MLCIDENDLNQDSINNNDDFKIDDTITKLENLKRLHEQKLISDDEYNRSKDEIIKGF